MSTNTNDRLDAMIDEALSAEERDLLHAIGDEPGYFSQVWGVFGGPTGWVSWLLMLFQTLMFAAPFHSVTWHSTSFPGEYCMQCFGTISDYWSPTAEQGVESWRVEDTRRNIWVADLSALNLDTIYGLRVNGGRGIRAKYPNGNPELSGPAATALLQYTAGWVSNPTGLLCLWEGGRGRHNCSELICSGRKKEAASSHYGRSSRYPCPQSGSSRRTNGTPPRMSSATHRTGPE